MVSETLADGDYLDLGAGFVGADTEAIVTVLDHGGDMELYMYDGSLSTLGIVATAFQGAGIDPAPTPLPIVKNGQRYRMKNVSGGPTHMRAGGVVTK